MGSAVNYLVYPLYPVASSFASVLLLLVLLSSYIRQSWNLGVAFLCFWLFFDNLTAAVNAIVWSDNADIKLYVYCDIGQSVLSQCPISPLLNQLQQSRMCNS